MHFTHNYNRFQPTNLLMASIRWAALTGSIHCPPLHTSPAASRWAALVRSGTVRDFWA
jgi:hypothetical protein